MASNQKINTYYKKIMYLLGYALTLTVLVAQTSFAQDMAMNTVMVGGEAIYPQKILLKMP